MSTEELVERVRRALGLNLYEARAYIALLRGAGDYKSTSREGGIPMPRVYDVLESLKSKGLVVRSGGFYKPVGLEAAAAMTASRIRLEAERRASEVLREGVELARVVGAAGGAAVEGEAELLEGFEQVLARFSEELLRSGRVYLLVKKAARFRSVFLNAIESLPRRPGLLRAVVQAGEELDEESLGRARRLGVEVRLAPYIPYDTLVSDSGTIIIGFPDPRPPGDKRPVAVLVRSRRAADAALKELEEEWASLGGPAPPEDR